MGILPVLNCADFESVKQTVEKAKTFLPEGSFLHLDIADAVMTFHKTWNDPTAWANLRAPYALEVHLMVENPEDQVEAWIAAGARRFVVHFESLNDASFAKILDHCKKRSVGIALSSNPETTIDRLAPYLRYFSMFQVLSVHPGVAGQAFLSFSLDKIKWFRREYPRAIIEVDGGMNPQTAKLVKDAGADFIVSSSYIFGSGDPGISYKILKSV
jgi:ribulose-phosphate 3-epimerase